MIDDNTILPVSTACLWSEQDIRVVGSSISSNPCRFSPWWVTRACGLGGITSQGEALEA